MFVTEIIALPFQTLGFWAFSALALVPAFATRRISVVWLAFIVAWIMLDYLLEVRGRDAMMSALWGRHAPLAPVHPFNRRPR